MPNWCRNTVTAVGSAADVEVLVAAVASLPGADEATAFDLARIVPQPEEPADGDLVAWRERHWGVKWTVEADAPFLSAGGQVARWQFTSAWCGPGQALVALSESHPDVLLVLAEDEPGNGVFVATALLGGTSHAVTMEPEDHFALTYGLSVTLTDCTVLADDDAPDTTYPLGHATVHVDARATNPEDAIFVTWHSPARALETLLAGPSPDWAAWDSYGDDLASTMPLLARRCMDALTAGAITNQPLAADQQAFLLSLVLAHHLGDAWDPDLSIFRAAAADLLAGGCSAGSAARAAEALGRSAGTCELSDLLATIQTIVIES